jgi:hypothetical protein
LGESAIGSKGLAKLTEKEGELTTRILLVGNDSVDSGFFRPCLATRYDRGEASRRHYG